MATDRTPAIIGEYKQHPIAQKLMPEGMDDQEFDAFCEDVESRGVLMPITLYENMVLDGWHRYRAAHRTGTSYKHTTYTGDDPAGYIASVNVLRRKLSSLQRTLVAARLHKDHGMTQRDVCKKLAVSNQILTLVLRALESRNTKIISRIEKDSEFTRGMLKEELEDAGLMRSKPEPDGPVGPNSVFDMGNRTGKEGTITLAPSAYELLKPKDTDGSDDALPVVGKGKKASDAAARKPTLTAAQMLADQFKAMLYDEKVSFLTLIWPEAQVVCADAGLKLPPAIKRSKK